MKSLISARHYACFLFQDYFYRNVKNQKQYISIHIQLFSYNTFKVTGVGHLYGFPVVCDKTKPFIKSVSLQCKIGKQTG